MPAIIIVQIDTDKVPGWGYDPEDFATLIRKYLKDTVNHYNPSVQVASPKLSDHILFGRRP